MPQINMIYHAKLVQLALEMAKVEFAKKQGLTQQKNIDMLWDSHNGLIKGEIIARIMPLAEIAMKQYEQPLRDAFNAGADFEAMNRGHMDFSQWATENGYLK